MTLKFTPPPLAEKAIPRLGYYSEGQGLRTFSRQCDVQNSINYQHVGKEATAETKDLEYRYRRYEYIYRTDVYILESIDGVWYTRIIVPKGTLVNQDHRHEQVVEVKTGYNDSYNYSSFKPLSTLEDYQARVLADQNSTSSYKTRSAQVVWRKKQKATLLEEYINWRISVGKEIWTAELTSLIEPATV